jgi:hypothetical protein
MHEPLIAAGGAAPEEWLGGVSDMALDAIEVPSGTGEEKPRCWYQEFLDDC